MNVKPDAQYFPQSRKLKFFFDSAFLSQLKPRNASGDRLSSTNCAVKCQPAQQDYPDCEKAQNSTIRRDFGRQTVTEVEAVKMRVF